MSSELKKFLAPVENLILEYEASDPSLADGYVFVHQEGVVCLDGFLISNSLPDWVSSEAVRIHLGCFNHKNIGVIDVSQCTPAHIDIIPLRQALSIVSRDELAVLRSAVSLVSWNQRYQFCFSCGVKLVSAKDERAKVCNACNTRCYPHVSPCVIMAVRKDRQILLARSSRFKAGTYSVLAGFIESGESAEEAVHREVLEESGIRVKNLEYMGSQAWPFPSQLMLGFLCDYASGDVKIDLNELESGGWFNVDDLPDMSSRVSISYYLIQEVVRRIKLEDE